MNEGSLYFITTARIDFRWVGELEKLVGSVAGMVPLTRDVSTVNNLIDTGRSKDRRPRLTRHKIISDHFPDEGRRAIEIGPNH